MTAHATSVFRQGLACILCGLAWPAAALGLGDLRVHSYLGEPLDATIVLKTRPREVIEPGCFRLGNARGTDLLVAAQPTIAVENQKAVTRLRLRTVSAIHEPAVQVRLNAACPGGRATTRDYELLLSSRVALPQASAGAAADRDVEPAAPEPSPPGGQGLRALPGDTLASIATAIYPNRPALSDAYVQAIRAENAALAGLAADEPIAAGTLLTLPDLRRFSRSLAAAPAGARRPAPHPASQSSAAAPTSRIAERPMPRAKPAEATDAVPPAPRATGGRFVLRLSAPEVDLSRSRGIDDRMRSQLRDRLLVLDADDQVAALLSMRNSLRQLEGRVAELQLKLSALPAAAPAKTAAAASPAPQPAPAAPASVPAPIALPPAEKPASPMASPPLPEGKPAALEEKPAAPEVKIAAPELKPAAPEVKAPATELKPGAPEVKPAAPEAKTPATAAKPRRAVPSAPASESAAEYFGLQAWLWGVIALFVAGIGAMVWRVLSRRPEAEESPVAQDEASDMEEAEASMRGGDASGRGEDASPGVGEHRFLAESDASLATSIPGADPRALRRRYIEERFPEISGGTIVLDQAESVVKAARLFYEDGATARAIELLQFVVEEDPAKLKPWLALFEIFRLEGLSAAFADLAARFREHHGSTESWRKVQYIGREMDPANLLFREAPFNNLETIGYPASKRSAPVTFDPLAENWLNAPMDFTTDALAASLHEELLAQAGVKDSDLIADPMPALKSVEMFNVA